MSNKWDNDDGSAGAYSLELIERLRENYGAQWWHFGGGIMGIAIEDDKYSYVIGAADYPLVGMQVEPLDDLGTQHGDAEFGSIETSTPEQMADKIHSTIINQTWDRG